MNSERLEKLLDAYFDEALTAEERQELEHALLSSPQARELFWKRARFQNLLYQHGTERWGEKLAKEFGGLDKPISPLLSLPPKRSWPKDLAEHLWVPLSLAASIMLLALLWRHQPTSEPASKDTLVQVQEMPAPQGIAELVRSVGAEWMDVTNHPNLGAVLTPGWLKLKRGLVELEFYRGTRVVLEGPAEFQLISDMEARCALGKVRFEVPPPAHGFKVLASKMQVVDRGTAFGLEVLSDGRENAVVFKGEIEVASSTPSQPMHTLTTGQAIHADANGQLSEIGSESGLFISPDDLETRAHEKMQQRFLAWQDFSLHLSQDPSVVLYYDFESKYSPAYVLRNSAPSASTESHGTIIGCEWTGGRWPGKRALDFKQFGDRIRFSLPMTATSITCSAWIRLDGLNHIYNALMMAGDARVGELQWQFRQNGDLLFGRRNAEGWGSDKNETAASPSVLGPVNMGLWMHVAFVYDSTTHTLTHYLNGEAICARDMRPQPSIVMDSMEIGNWTPHIGQPIEPIRNFNGRIDEFMIFKRPLSPAEIRQIHEIGKVL